MTDDGMMDMRPLPLLDVQADLHYHAAPARAVFNPPAATGMPFWSVNPYIGCAFGCAYCYARDTHRWTLERAGGDGSLVRGDLPPWLAFERRILVKEGAGDRVRDAFRSTRAPRAGDALVIGTATDPYQPAERRFRVTRGVLEALCDARGLRLTIITKSPLVTRDIDVLARLAVHHRVRIQLSLITLDRELARRLEPRAPTPESRLRAIRRLAEAGISVSVNCMPVLPGITDRPDALAALVEEVADAGASSLAACALRLRSASRRRYMPVVREGWPELAANYERAYRNSIYASDSYRAGLQQFIERLCKAHGLTVREMPPPAGAETPSLEAPTASAQLTLQLQTTGER